MSNTLIPFRLKILESRFFIFHGVVFRFPGPIHPGIRRFTNDENEQPDGVEFDDHCTGNGVAIECSGIRRGNSLENRFRTQDRQFLHLQSPDGPELPFRSGPSPAYRRSIVVAGMAGYYRKPWLATPLTVVRAGHAREKQKNRSKYGCLEKVGQSGCKIVSNKLSIIIRMHDVCLRHYL